MPGIITFNRSTIAFKIIQQPLLHNFGNFRGTNIKRNKDRIEQMANKL